tara:strand:+ start:99 stop:257 length:159 start_codon:yes stop_codon:yes gene_type:complete
MIAKSLSFMAFGKIVKPFRVISYKFLENWTFIFAVSFNACAFTFFILDNTTF